MYYTYIWFHDYESATLYNMLYILLPSASWNQIAEEAKSTTTTLASPGLQRDASSSSSSNNSETEQVVKASDGGHIYEAIDHSESKFISLHL